VVFLAGGGHARVLMDSLLEYGTTEIVGLLDAAPARPGADLYGIPILGDDALLGQMCQRGVTHFVVGLGGVRDNGPRRRLFDAGLAAGLQPLEVRHRSAIVSSRATLQEGCQLLPGCVVNAGAALGRNVLVNSAAVVEHDCVVEAHAHVASGAVVAATVRIGEAAHVGARAVIRQGISVGPRAVVGVGAVVIRDVEADAVVAGVPARVIDRNPTR